MTKALRVPDYLTHILGAIERISRYTANMDEVEYVVDAMASLPAQDDNQDMRT